MSNKLSQQHSFEKNSVFRLRDLLTSSWHLWLCAWVLGLITAISVISLLMVSGWFLTVTAFSGLLAVSSVNYALVSHIIRLLAVMCTVGRYSELMVSHHAIFILLKNLRVKFFNSLAKRPLTDQHQTLQSTQKMHRLVRDINILNEFNLRVILPYSIAVVVIIILAGIIVFSLPNTFIIEQLLLIVLLGSCLILAIIMMYKGVEHSHKVATLEEHRRSALLSPLTVLTQLLIWQQWTKHTTKFIDYDSTLHQLEWRSNHYKNQAIVVVQWLVSASVIVLLVTTITFLPTQNWSHISILLAVLFGLFALPELLSLLVHHYHAYGNALSSKQRLNELLEGNAIVTHNKPTILPLPTGTLTLTLDKLYAKQPNAIVGAENVTITVQSGIPLIISGKSGCGKSTLLQTLAHELEPQSGTIALNGTPWQNYDWQDQLGYLGQQIDIFDQTLAENLRLGNSQASDEQLMAVLDAVALSEWVQAQPQGLSTHLGEYGTAISGGQARRIALARLLLKPRKILLLDEPFAGLDQQNQTKIWQMLKKYQKNCILIVVSHHHNWYNREGAVKLDL